MISDARDYIRARFSEEETDLHEHLDAFNFENIPENLIDNAYHISLSLGSEVQLGNCFTEESITATVQVFKSTFNDEITTFDALMDTAHNIKLRAINPGLWVGTFKRVTVPSITASPIDTNDNIIRVTMEWDFKMVFSAI